MGLLEAQLVFLATEPTLAITEQDVKLSPAQSKLEHVTVTPGSRAAGRGITCLVTEASLATPPPDKPLRSSPQVSDPFRTSVQYHGCGFSSK